MYWRKPIRRTDYDPTIKGQSRKRQATVNRDQCSAASAIGADRRRPGSFLPTQPSRSRTAHPVTIDAVVERGHADQQQDRCSRPSRRWRPARGCPRSPDRRSPSRRAVYGRSMPRKVQGSRSIWMISGSRPTIVVPLVSRIERSFTVVPRAMARRSRPRRSRRFDAVEIAAAELLLRAGQDARLGLGVAAELRLERESGLVAVTADQQDRVVDHDPEEQHQADARRRVEGRIAPREEVDHADQRHRQRHQDEDRGREATSINPPSVMKRITVVRLQPNQ